MAHAVIINDPHALPDQVFIPLCMCFKRTPALLLDIKDKHRKPSLLCHCRIKLAQRAGRTVSRVCKRPLSGQFLALVHFLEILVRHVNLAPDFQVCKRLF